jgi:hypothetical protein
LEQKINTALQYRGLCKLLGFNYRIEYKKCVDNKVADALSRRNHTSDQLLCLHYDLFAFSELIPQWVHDIKLSYTNDSWISQQLASLQTSPTVASHYSLHQGVLRFKGRICVGNSHNWRQLIL